MNSTSEKFEFRDLNFEFAQKRKYARHSFEHSDFGFGDCLAFRISNLEFTQKGGD